MWQQQGLSPPELCDFHREKTQSVLNEFKARIDNRIRLTPPNGLLGKALSYTLNHWLKLVRYVEDDHITPDNNASENAIRRFVVGLKNRLFAGHPNGARAGATLFSLIETAEACGLEPYRYLRFLFEKFPRARSIQDHEALLPQRLTEQLPL